MKKKKTSTKRIIILAAIGIILIGVVAAYLISEKSGYVPYKDFVQALEAGSVESVTISGDTLHYQMKDDWHTYNTENPETDEFKESVLLKGIKVERGLSSGDYETIGMLLIMVALVIVMAKFFMDNNGDGDQYNVSPKTGVTFDDVIGLEDIKTELRITLDILKNTQKYKEQGVRIPKGIVLEGDPGNGKTLLAKAIAGEAGLNFISANAADFGGIIVGKGSNQVKKLFREARKNKPCIVFIDEFDSVAEKRKTDGTAASTDDSKTLTAFLNELDGFKSNNDGVFLVVATNRPEVIDSAMIRPGRFDKRYHINNPSYEERLKLIELYGSNKHLSPEVSKERLAWEFSGFSCSMIEMLINEAAILSVNRGHSEVLYQDIDDSVTKYLMRGGRTTLKVNREKQRIIAHHEAGHAVAGFLLAKEKISKISIIPSRSGMGGYTMTYDEEDLYLPTIDELEKKVLMFYAGRAAEYVLNGSANAYVTTGADNDISNATEYIMKLSEIENTEELLDYDLFGDSGADDRMDLAKEIAGRLWQESVDFVKANWTKIEAVSAYLEAHEVMTGAEFEKMMAES